MKILHRLSGEVLFSDSSESVSEANLIGADLSEANLIGADLSEANLSGADLSGADLYRADLYRADLSGADLSGANLRGADLSGANLIDASLSGATLSGAKGLPDVKKVPIKKCICARVCAAPEALKMSHWHTCETVHCLAGWAVTLHPQGPELEAKYGANVAGALIFHACEGEVPDFYSDNKTAIEWLKKTRK